METVVAGGPELRGARLRWWVGSYAFWRRAAAREPDERETERVWMGWWEGEGALMMRAKDSHPRWGFGLAGWWVGIR